MVVTEVFANLAATAARARGYALETLVLPHPMETRSDEEIVAFARQRFDEIVSRLVGPPARP